MLEKGSAVAFCHTVFQARPVSYANLGANGLAQATSEFRSFAKNSGSYLRIIDSRPRLCEMERFRAPTSGPFQRKRTMLLKTFASAFMPTQRPISSVLIITIGGRGLKR